MQYGGTVATVDVLLDQWVKLSFLGCLDTESIFII